MYFEGKKLQYLTLKIIIELQVGRDLRDHLVQPKPDLDWMSQRPVQPNLNSVQQWGIHCFLGEIIPMAGYFHWENFCCSVQLESPQN